MDRSRPAFTPIHEPVLDQENSSSDKREESRKMMQNTDAFLDHIEEVKKQLPPKEHFAIGQLDALQKIFFEKDWVFASWVDPTIQGEAASEAFKAYKSAGNQLDWNELLNRFSKGDPAHTPSPDKLREFYESRMQDRNQGFNDIATTLEAFSPQKDLMTSDLLTDAWTYVGLRSEIKDWWTMQSEERNEFATIIEGDKAEYQNQLPAGSIEVARDFERFQEETFKNRFQSILETYDEVFSWRFENTQGFQDPEALMDSLAKLELKNVMGKDITLPLP